MEFKVTLSHPKDELDGPSLRQVIIWAITGYITEKGHLSNYDSDEWNLVVTEQSQDS